MTTDLELYRVFCEVAKYQNISKTAENLFISQSAITQSIQKLENVLGGKVFYRTKKGVELTEEGKNLYEYIKDSIETMNNAENLFSNYINLEKGKIRIGGGNSLVKSLIFEPFLRFSKKYPDIDISIINGTTDQLMQSLVNGEIDLVVLNLPYKTKNYANVEYNYLKKSNYSFFATKKYIRENSIKKIEDIQRVKLILPKVSSARYKILEEYCKKQNLELQANYEVSSASIIKRMVLNHLGVGFTTTENLDNIKEEIKIIKNVKLNDVQEGIATLKNTMCNKATLELVKEIKQYYKQNL